MKNKTALLAIFLLCSLILQAQTTHIPDENFERALIALGYDDELDNYVLTSKISGVTSLPLSSESISDLTGIEDFRSLKSLSCRYNQLTKLDVSQNTALESLFCSHNLITSLIVTGATSLTNLTCDFNQLPNLDVSENTALTFLNCYANQLKSLDVTKNTVLLDLNCGGNQLRSLDVTINKSLVSLLCDYNQLTSLDVTKNKALIGLSCEDNQLTSLNVTQNTALTVLYCLDNQLSSLDLTQNTSLNEVYCNINQLTSLDVRNGNNSLIGRFYATNNPSLFCINVDNETDANAGLPPYTDWFKDATATYYKHCDIDMNISFVPGWNWFSVNVLHDDMDLENLLNCATEGDYIKNQTLSATYYENNGWFGSLAYAGLDPFSTYKIKTKSPCSANYSGSPVDVLLFPVGIVSGWNWISYLPQCSLPLSPENEALVSLTLQEGDYIKNQTLSSTYYDSYGWFGTLEMMEPLDGFMMRKQTADILNYPECPLASANTMKSTFTETAVHGSTFDPHHFEFNGSVTAIVHISGSQAGGENDQIMAYVDDQLRGVSEGFYFEPIGAIVFPIMVYSNLSDGEILTFKYFDSENELTYDCIETVEFSTDMIVANAYEPFKLNVNSVNGIEETFKPSDKLFDVYPNPANDLLNINTSISDLYFIKITSLNGQLILSKKFEGPNHKIDLSSYQKGVYFISIWSKDLVIKNKIIKL